MAPRASEEPTYPLEPVIASVFGLSRALYKRGVHGRAVQLQTLFDACVEEIERALA